LEGWGAITKHRVPILNFFKKYLCRRDGEEKEGAARERALLRIYGAGTREELEKNRAEVGSTMQGMAADKTIVLQMTPAMDKQVMSLASHLFSK
jgi:hypothetical protein